MFVLGEVELKSEIYFKLPQSRILKFIFRPELHINNRTLHHQSRTQEVETYFDEFLDPHLYNSVVAETTEQDIMEQRQLGLQILQVKTSVQSALLEYECVE